MPFSSRDKKILIGVCLMMGAMLFGIGVVVFGTPTLTWSIPVAAMAVGGFIKTITAR